MEGCNKGDNKMVELPPGFRFHPTDEELVTQYLFPKLLDCSFTTKAVGEVDLNKVEPWDLPWRANIGEKEWYFFCVRDRKYPNGSRTNRATDAGYWKATGKDKEIFRAKILVGMKKTLVFYRGRSPRGEKTNWVMHEYRLEGKNSSFFSNTDKEWVICRVFKKNSGGKEVHISGLVRAHDSTLNLPPLIDLSSDENSTNSAEGHYVKQDSHYESVDRHSSASNMNFFNPNSILSTQANPFVCPDSIVKQEQATLCHLFETNSPYMKPNAAAGFSQYFGENANMFPFISGYEDGLKPYQDLSTIISTEQIHIDCLWNC